jgi:intron-binding protein aquarius
MPPKKKPAASKAVDPEKLTVPKLKAELKKLGLEQDGLKAVLVARLKEALGGGEAPEPAAEAPAEPETKTKSKSPAKATKAPPAKAPEAPAGPEAKTKSKSPAKATKAPPAKAAKSPPAKSPPAKAPARAKRGAAAIEPEPEPEPEPMETDAPVESPKAEPAKGKSAKAPKAPKATPAEAEQPKPASQTRSPPAKRRKAETPTAAAEIKPTKPAETPSEPKAVAKPTNRGGLTLASIESDSLTKLAAKHWRGDVAGAWDEKVVEKIYADELGGGSRSPNLQRVQLLEISQYLEKYLWPHFDADKASATHVMSVVMMVNEKFREGVSAWTPFRDAPEKFAGFFKRVMRVKSEKLLSLPEKTAHLVFLVRAFSSLEEEMVRAAALPLVSLPLWSNLSEGRLLVELRNNAQLEKHWRYLQKKVAKAAKRAAKENQPPPAALASTPEATWLPELVDDFFTVCEGAVVGDKIDRDAVRFCERFIEFTIDVLSQLPTRRFVRAVLDERQVLVKARMMPLFSHAAGKLYSQLVDLFKFYHSFEIDDHAGTALSDEDVESKHYDRLMMLQRLCFKHIEKLREFSLMHCGAVGKRETLVSYLSKLDETELRRLATDQLRVVDPSDPWVSKPEFLLETLVSSFEKRTSQRRAVNAMPLYPNEDVLWDENVVPSVDYTGETCLALPKLNLQFLTFHDYLLRNFNLFRLEATYEIREDIADVLKRMAPRRGEDGASVRFTGWSRMAVPVEPGALAVTEVKAARVGENKPASVRCEVRVNLGALRGPAREEWDELKQHDVVFLLRAEGAGDGAGASPAERFGLRRARGAEIVEVRDGEGTLLNDFRSRGSDGHAPVGPSGYERTFVLELDAAQYQLDVDRGGSENDVYSSLNVLMRRRPKENNFKSILECIRDLMNADAPVPDWLHDVFLGYGDPAAAQGANMPREQRLATVDFKDTFLDAEHLRECFPDRDVRFATADGTPCDAPVPPFRVAFEENDEAKEGADDENAEKDEDERGSVSKRILRVESYVPPDPGPYPEDQPVLNAVRFTPTQVSAIASGVQPGLTMVVGPPGTGKTDTATQIMHCLYHNEPGQRTLLITHSNAALNDLFQKLMQRDVPARYLLRLGQGERDLDTDLDFSRQGRVNAMLQRRLELLAVVERLATSLGVPEDVAYTCETAGHFWLTHVLARWEKFDAAVAAARARGEAASAPSFVADRFPFSGFFADAPQPLFSGVDFEADKRKANGCMRHVREMFTELAECRAFELLKNAGDRSNYLLTKQAKVVAMTCTHAALKRKDFLRLGLKYDNLVMEESAQVLEIETFIPMMLQHPLDGRSRLKRVVLIGDHHQLPPVVKNLAFQKYCNMDQSLFARFVRLGNPTIQLNAQGRARPSLAKLYSWRYDALGDLPNTFETGSAYALANPGFARDAQFVDVQDYSGVGESAPTPHFYQNLGEAEYVVSVYQYMRLLGYPAEKISIITTYRGQKHLIRDVVNARCASHPLFGAPKSVTTVDKFQGQQNDYVLLSLVRTRAVGHIRDVRRLVVAMSRARLGLYVFGRKALFEQCYELSPSLRHLFEGRPTKLALVPTERFDGLRRAADETATNPYLVPDAVAMGHVVNQLALKWQQERMAAAATPPCSVGGLGSLSRGGAAAGARRG